MSDIRTLKRLADLERRLLKLETYDISKYVGARYTHTAGASIPNNSTTIVNFANSVYDTHSAVTTGASWKFVTPLAGYYTVSVSILYPSASWATGSVALGSVYVNGTDTMDLSLNASPGGTVIMWTGGSGTLKLAANAEVDFRTFQNSGGARNLETVARWNWIEIHMEHI